MASSEKVEKLEKALRLLEDLEEANREKAIRYLARSKDPRALPSLERTARGDDSLQLRFMAKEAMQRIRMHLTEGANLDVAISEPSAQPTAEAGPRPIDLEQLQRHLSVEDTEARNRSVKAAIAYMNPAALKVIMPALKRERSLKVKCTMVLAVGILGGREGIPSLLHYLEHREPALRAHAAAALGHVNDASVYPRLVFSLVDRDQDVRQACFRALGRLGKPKILKLLQKMSAAPHLWMRAAAARASGKFANTEVLPILRAGLGDEDPKVRKFARASLRKLERKGVAEAGRILSEYRQAGGELSMSEMLVPAPLATPLNDKDPRVRLAEVQRIVTDKDVAQLDAVKLRTKLEDDERVLASLLIALGRLGGREAVPLIRDYLGSGDRRVRASAVEAMSFVDSPTIVPLLVPMLGDPDNRTRANAIVALKGALDVDVITPLREMAQSEDRNAKLSAVYAILELQRPEAALLLTALLQDPDDLVVKKAQRAKKILADANLMAPSSPGTSPSGGGPVEVQPELETPAPSEPPEELESVAMSTSTSSPTKLPEAGPPSAATEVPRRKASTPAKAPPQDDDDETPPVPKKKNLPGFRTQIDDMFAKAAKEEPAVPKKEPPPTGKKGASKQVKAPGRPVEPDLFSREGFLDKIKSLFDRGEAAAPAGKGGDKGEAEGKTSVANIAIIGVAAVVIVLVAYFVFFAEDGGDEEYDKDNF